MFERFTERAIKSIMLAQDEARRLRHNYVGTEQILLGLLAENNGIAARALEEHGLTFKQTRLDVEKLIGFGKDKVAQEIPFTPRAKRLLEYSYNESRLFNHDYIGTEHVLLGLIKDGGGVSCTILRQRGVDLEALRYSVLRLMGKPVYAQMPTTPITPAHTGDLASGAYIWYTTTAVAGIKNAINAANTLGHDELLPEHLLLGLMMDPTIVSDVLIPAGAEPVNLRREIMRSAQPGNASAGNLKISEVTGSVLSHAWIYALHHRSLVTVECVLLGLLKEEAASRLTLFKEAGINLARVRGHALHQLDCALLAADSAAALNPAEKGTSTGTQPAWALPELPEAEIARLSAEIAKATNYIASKPKDVAGYVSRAEAYHSLGMKQQAVEDWDRALCLKDNLELRITRASALKELRRFREALTEVSAALRIEPTCAPAYHLRGQVLQSLGETQPALDAFNEAIRLNSDNSAYLSSRAGLLVCMNSFAAAEADLEKAIALFPRNAAAHNLLAYCYLQKHLFEQALASAETAVSLQSNGKHRAQKALILYGLGQTQQAKEEFESTLASTAEMDEASIETRAEFWKAIGVQHNCIADCLYLLKLNPASISAKNLLVSCNETGAVTPRNDAGASSTVDGRWLGFYTGSAKPDQRISFSLNLVTEGNRVTGKLSTASASREVSGTLSDGSLRFTQAQGVAKGADEPVYFRGQLSSDFELLTGTWSTVDGDQSLGNWQALRVDS
jgi:tetratricopeptide (TPR) repeat protein